MKRKIQPSTMLNVLVLSGSLILVLAAWCTYRDRAGMPLPGGDVRLDDRAAMLPQELRILLAEVPPPTFTQYGTVAEKNLFSPDRREWAPPPPAATEETMPEHALPAPQTQRVRLYGTIISQDIETALLYFEQFSSPRKHRIMEVGETVWDESNDGNDASFVLVRLEKDLAVLEDQLGLEHVVRLYDHQRKPVESVAHVLLDKLARHDAAVSPRPPSEASETDDENGPIRRMEDIPKSLEEREQLAREGRLLRINTPFGPVFRPVE